MLSRSLAVLLPVVLLLAGCTAAPAADSDSTQPPTEEVTAESVVGEVDVTVGSATLTVQAYPIIRTDEEVILTLDVTVQDDPSHVLADGPLDALASVWGTGSDLGLSTWVGVRLVDWFADKVVTPALDTGGEAVVVRSEASARATAERIQLAYGDPLTNNVSVFIPQGGVIDEVPIIYDTVPSVEGVAAFDTGMIASAPVSPIVSNSVDLASATRTDVDADKAVIALSADFLFAYDSADLTPEARAAIESAASQIERRAPGPVDVVGHTDADGEDAYNQDLSERRAASVAAVLTELIDAGDYPLVVSGRGEAEPVASEGTVEANALNRRVELKIATEPLGTSAETSSTAELPGTAGPVATGEDGVDIDGARPLHISAPRAYVLNNRLVVEIRTETMDDEGDSPLDPLAFEGSLAGPNGLESQNSMAGVAVLDGSIAIRPMLHQAAESSPTMLIPVTDLTTSSRLDGGHVRTSAVMYPYGVYIGDTVTVQLLTGDDTGWRLTDIPVEQ